MLKEKIKEPEQINKLLISSRFKKNVNERLNRQSVDMLNFAENYGIFQKDKLPMLKRSRNYSNSYYTQVEKSDPNLFENSRLTAKKIGNSNLDTYP